MAISTVIVPGTHFTNFLETRWSPKLLLDTSEEMLIANKFMQNGDLDIDKIGNLLYIRKVAAKTTNKMANNTTAMDAESLTFEADTEVAVSLSPQFAYTAAAFNEDVKQRMMAFPKYEKAVRTQFLRSMPAQIDADAGGLGSELSVSVSDTNLSASLVRNALGTLRTNAQREYKTGKVGGAVLRLHPSQQQHLYGIPEINNAELRGDSDNPNVTGLLVKAWGADIDISGNIESAGGNRQNLLFIKQAFALVYNAEPQIQAPYQDGLATVVAGFCDYAVGEIYDAYAVSIRTAA
jgi:hypothetical protein